MDLAGLRVVKAVADTGSVSRAAEALNCVQSNVTARVKRLEEDLGVDLFLRLSRGMEPTPAGRVLAGYAEVVKYGLIRQPDFFAWLERNGRRVVDGDSDARRHAVTVSCRAKADIVGVDERESGDRALLNLGHTFGHALEAATGFGQTLLHGEAVAIGMVLAFDLSVRLGLCPAEDARRARAHLAEVGLPVRPADIPGVAWDVDGLVRSMAKDKKVQDGRITFILADRIGNAFTRRDVDAAAVRAVLEEAVTPA